MKKITRLLSLLLALVMLLAAAVACTQTGPSDDTTQDPDGSTTSDTTTAPARESFELIKDGVAQITIVRHADLPTSHPDVEAAIAIRSAIKELLTDSDIRISDDWIMPGTTHDPEAVEILVGATNYDETSTVASGMSYGDSAVRAVGNKIVVFGYSNDTISAAVEKLCMLIRVNTKDGETAGTKTVSIPAADLNWLNIKNEALSVIPYYEGATYTDYYDSGDDCHELIFNKADPDDYAAYISTLQNVGFTKYTENDMNGNLFTTLYNDKYTLNVGYYKHNNQARVIIEPFSDATLIGLESDNKYEKITTSQITMIGCEYQSAVNDDGSPKYAGNGLSMLIRLCDGRFIVIDAGFNTSACATNLYNTLLEQSRDYAKKVSDIKIAAWIITHAHSDHYGSLVGKTSTFKGIKVERLIANFMSEEERSLSVSKYPDNWTVNEGSSGIKVIAAAEVLGAKVIKAHVGQEFYFADTSLEVLYTTESYAPSAVNALNTTSLIILATTTDPDTGKSTKTMITGDATGPAFAICNAMYGKYMKCDIVQVAHHGYSTWGQSQSTASAYTFMAPTTVLWPQGLNAYPSYKNLSYNVTLHNSSNPNWKETYVAGWSGSTTTVPLPYTYGVDTVVQNLTKQP
jgi:hypothetical protein